MPIGHISNGAVSSFVNRFEKLSIVPQSSSDKDKSLALQTLSKVSNTPSAEFITPLPSEQKDTLGINGHLKENLLKTNSSLDDVTDNSSVKERSAHEQIKSFGIDEFFNIPEQFDAQAIAAVAKKFVEENKELLEEKALNEIYCFDSEDPCEKYNIKTEYYFRKYFTQEAERFFLQDDKITEALERALPEAVDEWQKFGYEYCPNPDNDPDFRSKKQLIMENFSYQIGTDIYGYADKLAANYDSE